MDEFRAWDQKITQACAPLIGFTFVGGIVASLVSGIFLESDDALIAVLAGAPVIGLFLYLVTRNTTRRSYFMLLLGAFFVWLVYLVVSSVIWFQLDLPTGLLALVLRGIVAPIVLIAVAYAVPATRSTVFAWLGRVYNTVNMPERALAAFSKAIEINPRNAKVLLFRAGMHREFDNLDQERVDLDRAIEVSNTKSQKFTAYLVKASNRDLAGDYKAAAESATQALESSVRVAQKALALVVRGQAYMRLDNHDAAFADFEGALPILPSHQRPLAHALCGATHLSLENYEEAQQQYEAAARYHPRGAESRIGMALIQRASGDLDGAIEIWKALIAQGAPVMGIEAFKKAIAMPEDVYDDVEVLIEAVKAAEA